MTVRRVILGAEFLFLFAGLPLALALFARGRPVLPALWIATAVVGVCLARDRSFDRGVFRGGRCGPADRRRIMVRWLVSIAVLTGALLLVSPSALLHLPRERLALWGFLMVFYPALSVVPQAIVYRAFLLHRYAPLFPRPGVQLAAAALAFSAAHIVFLNPWAVAFTLIGGWFFTDTYLRTRSLWASALEHALYGCFLITIGWGRFFYAGSLGTAQAWTGW